MSVCTLPKGIECPYLDNSMPCDKCKFHSENYEMITEKGAKHEDIKTNKGN